MPVVSNLCTPSSTNCACHDPLSTGNASSWVWQEFGIFENDAAPAKRRRRFPPLIPDGTCHLNSNDASNSRPSPSKKAKASNDSDDIACHLSRSVSSTVSLSEEECKDKVMLIATQRGGGGSAACQLRGGGRDDESMTSMQTNYISITKQIATFLKEEAEYVRLEESCLHPHPLTNDVLSRIAFTPFDGDEMMKCFRNKASNIANGSAITFLPVIPQKKFIDETNRRKMIASINKEVSTFLLDEAAKIEQEGDTSQRNDISPPNAILNGTCDDSVPPPPSYNDANELHSKQPNSNDRVNKYCIRLKNWSAAIFGLMHDDSVAFVGYKTKGEEMSPSIALGDVVVAIDGKMVSDLEGTNVMRLLDMRRDTIHEITFANRKWYDGQNAPKNLAEAKEIYDNSMKLSVKLQQMLYNTQRYIEQNLNHEDNSHGKLNEVKAHFGVAEKLRTMTWSKRQEMAEAEGAIEEIRAMAADKAVMAKKKPIQTATASNVINMSHIIDLSKLPEADKSGDKRIPTATASKVIQMSHIVLSKFPIGFAYKLGDEYSKTLATSAATKWRVEGKKASNSIFIGRKMSESKVTPESRRNTTKSPTQPRTGTQRTPAALLSSEAMGPKYLGWTTKTFQRVSGTSAGTKDKYFYSPHHQFKFRSMKGVDIFILILKEPAVNGDETKAWKVYKGRGYRN